MTHGKLVNKENGVEIPVTLTDTSGGYHAVAIEGDAPSRNARTFSADLWDFVPEFHWVPGDGIVIDAVDGVAYIRQSEPDKWVFYDTRPDTTLSSGPAYLSDATVSDYIKAGRGRILLKEAS